MILLNALYVLHELASMTVLLQCYSRAKYMLAWAVVCSDCNPRISNLDPGCFC